jgi:hypothetical protein
VAVDVAGIGQFLSHVLSTDARLSKLLTEEQLQRFKSAVRETQVKIEDADLRDARGRAVPSEVVTAPEGMPRDGLIRLSRGRWMEHWEDGWNMLRFTFHDYLRAAKIEDANYKISRRLPYRNEQYLSHSDVFRYQAATQRQTATGSDTWLREIVLAEVDRFSVMQGVTLRSLRVAVLKNGRVVAARKDLDRLPRRLGELRTKALPVLKQQIDTIPRGELVERTEIPAEEQQSSTYVYLVYPTTGTPFPILRFEKDSAYGLKGYAGASFAPVLDYFLNIAVGPTVKWDEESDVSLIRL